MKVKVVELESRNKGILTKGKVYESYLEGALRYLIDDEGDRMYFDLDKGTYDWGNERLGFTFGEGVTLEEVQEDTYNHATSPKVMAEVLLKMADNISKGLRPKEGIQIKINGEFRVVKNDSIYLDKLLEYRVKPDTITLKNGIEIPKPLPLNSLECYHKHREVYFPVAMKTRYNCIDVSDALEEYAEEALFYLTKEEAIEASKALFGLEVKE